LEIGQVLGKGSSGYV
jgi:serine/threonine protein kinase